MSSGVKICVNTVILFLSAAWTGIVMDVKIQVMYRLVRRELVWGKIPDLNLHSKWKLISFLDVKKLITFLFER